MIATDFVTNKTLRDKYIDRVDVLDKIAVIPYISGTQYFTMQQIADFYEVPLQTINTCYARNREEIDMDGVVVMTPKTYREFTNYSHQDVSKKLDCEQYRTHMIIHINENTDVIIPNRGIKVFPKNAFLRIGMLLTQSQVALQVRTYLIKAENTFSPSLAYNPADKNSRRQMVAQIVGAIFDDEPITPALCTQYFKSTEQYICKIEDSNEKLRHENQVLINDKIELTDRQAFTKAVRRAATELHTPIKYVYGAIYSHLLNKYSINLKTRATRAGGNTKPIDCIKDNEWRQVQSTLIAYLEDNGLGGVRFMEKVLRVD